MNSAKRSAATLLMVGSIIWLVYSILQLFNLLMGIDLYYFGYLGYWLSFVALILQVVASALIMAGIVKYRGTLSAQMTPPSSSAYAQAPTASARFCPRCGRQIAIDAKFCPHCGWQAT